MHYSFCVENDVVVAIDPNTQLLLHPAGEEWIGRIDIGFKSQDLSIVQLESKKSPGKCVGNQLSNLSVSQKTTDQDTYSVFNAV